jgi:septation ring formation regulator EzrA
LNIRCRTWEKSYHGIPKLIDDNNVEIAELEQKLTEIRTEIKDVSKTLTAFEAISSDTYVQNLIYAERERQKAEEIGNGIKSADASLYNSIRTDLLAEKVVEVVEKKPAEPIVQYQPPKMSKR